MKIIEITSDTAQASKNEITAIKRANFLPVRLVTRKIRLTTQAKTPESLSKPIITIIPTRKRITSSDENSITCSKSMVLVSNSIDVPIKAKLRRKSQKKSVPNMDAENIPMERDCCAFIPAKCAQEARKNENKNKEKSFKDGAFIYLINMARPLDKNLACFLTICLKFLGLFFGDSQSNYAG